MDPEPKPAGAAHANRRPILTCGKVAAALFLAPICLVGGMLLWLDYREHSWAPEPWRETVAPQPGYDDMVAAARLADEDPYTRARVKQPSEAPGPAARDPRNDPHLSELRETVGKNREAIARLRTVVVEPCWVTYDADADGRSIGPRVGLRDGSALGRLADVLAMDCRLHQADSDWAGSVEPGLNCLEMGLNLERGRDVISALHGDAVVSTGAQPLWHTAPRLDSGSARAAALRVEGMADDAPTYRQLLSWWTPLLAREHASKGRFDGMSGMLGTPANSPQGHRWADIAAEHLDRLSQWQALIHMPGPRERYRQMTRWLTALSGAVDKPYDHYTPPATRGLEWAAKEGHTWADTRYKWPAMAANLRLLSANLALRAYRADHGHYPDSLAELVPTELRHLPPDPFTSGPLRYRRESQSFLCWSIGPDGRDDQARRVTRGESNSPANGVWVVSDSVGDIVTP